MANLTGKDNHPPSESELFTYRNKGYLRRFFIVYRFYIKNLILLIWDFKIYRKLVSIETWEAKEIRIYNRLGQECKELFLKLGGVYIKLGQFLSNLNHILPLTFTSHLQDLQDRLPPHPFEPIRQRLEQELGTNIEQSFPEFDQVPIAAASTAQVHIAYIGEKKLAVKVLYPGIEKLVAKDLKTVYFIMKRINRYLFSFDFRTIHREIAVVISREMDLSKEAQSIEKMAGLLRKEKNLIVPEVYKEFSRKGVLVTGFIEGMKISETIGIKYKSTRKSRPLTLLLRAYILMIFRFRFFHADPHPGNLIYTPEGKLCFIDFGSVGYLEESTESSLRKIMLAAVSKDYYGVIDGMEEMGFFRPNVNKEKLEQIARFAFEKLERFIRDTDTFQNISMQDVNPEEVHFFLEGINTSLYDLLKISQIPSNYIMLERVLALLLGHIAFLDPYRTVFDYAKAPFYSIVGVEDSKLQQIIKEDGSELAVDFVSLPGDLHRALVKLNRGRIVMRNKDTEKQTEKIHHTTRHIVYTLLCIAFIHFGNFFYMHKNLPISYSFYTIGALAGLKLVWSLMKDKPESF